MWKSLDASFWGFSSTYVSKCRSITRRRRDMVDSAFESWGSIFLNLKKILIVRTHPEELRVIKCISSTDISTNFSQQWGQRMLTKCYPTSQGCSYDFQRLKVWPLGVPKPYRTSSNDVPSLLTRSTICVIFWFYGKFVESNTNTKSVNPVRSDEGSYEDVRYGFGTPKGHTFSLWKSQEHPCDGG